MNATETQPSETQQPTPPAAPAPPLVTPPKRRKQLLPALGAVAAVLGLLYGVHAWRYAATHVETDNAILSGHLHVVSARIAGNVAAVLVNDDQVVSAGQPLVQLDARDAEVRLAQARAALGLARRRASLSEVAVGVADGSARGRRFQAQGVATTASAALGSTVDTIEEAHAGVGAAEALLAQARSNQVRTRADLARTQKLFDVGGLSQQQLETARNLAESDAAHVLQASQAVTQAKARWHLASWDATRATAQVQASQGDAALAGAAELQVGVSKLQLAADREAVAQAEAQYKDAALQLSYTRIDAPAAGRVGRKVVEVGQQLSPGQALLAVVEDDVWIVANFKETQIEKMQAGQRADVVLDAFPGHPLVGHVASLSPASGAEFSLLPPDNATGNFTKIVQRVPVKILLDAPDLAALAGRLSPGMSAEVSVSLTR